MPHLPATERDLDVEDVELTLPAAVSKDFGQASVAFVRLSEKIKKLEEQKKELRSDLLQFIETYGYESGNGSQSLDLEKPVAGFATLIRQRSVKRLPPDEGAIERILRDNDLYERCMRPVMQPDDNEIWQCAQAGLINDDELLEMYPQKETYSLVPRKK